ncbi:MAG TPA: methyl-accepting chemotaxis protein, partial [Gammaproteobacteria bacterium]|nr:methyl-accepting chemotaxis protein [Gammaproteobacteria bacterium]
AKEVSIKGMDKYKDDVIKHYIQEFSDDYANNNGGLQFDATPYLNVSNPSTFALQYNYIFNNPYGIDKEQSLAYVDDGSTYSKFHAQYHDHLRELANLFNLEDIFLVDANTGYIVYTVAKGLDFTTSLIDGPYANSAVGKAFNEANTNDGKKRVIVSDFAPYSPSNDDQASFVATPIFDNGLKVGILIFQLNSKTINEIMTSGGRWEDVGLGQTGETYIIDKQHRILNNSRFEVQNPDAFHNTLQKIGATPDVITRMKAKKNNIGLMTINTLAADQVVEGQTGYAIYKDYRGVDVLGAYEPLKIPGLDWGIIAEIDKAEAFAPIYALAKKMAINLAGIMLLIIAFATIVGVGLARQISAPIEKLSVAIRLLAESHDLTKRIKYDSNDEIGDMVGSLNQLLDSFQKTYQETVLSSQKMQTTAHKLMSIADEIDSRESMHKFEDNYDAVHEKTAEIKNASDSLTELSDRLGELSKQFKVFEEESDRTSSW